MFLFTPKSRLQEQADTQVAVPKAVDMLAEIWLFFAGLLVIAIGTIATGICLRFGYNAIIASMVMLSGCAMSAYAWRMGRKREHSAPTITKKPARKQSGKNDKQ